MILVGRRESKPLGQACIWTGGLRYITGEATDCMTRNELCKMGAMFGMESRAARVLPRATTLPGRNIDIGFPQVNTDMAIDSNGPILDSLAVRCGLVER